MFELGEKYDITMLEWGDDGPGPVHIYGQTATEIDGTLVKFVSPAVKVDLGEAGAEDTPASEMIVNTTSLYFVSAVPSKH